jgi:hypothetical protein
MAENNLESSYCAASLNNSSQDYYCFTEIYIYIYIYIY